MAAKTNGKAKGSSKGNKGSSKPAKGSKPAKPAKGKPVAPDCLGGSLGLCNRENEKFNRDVASLTPRAVEVLAYIAKHDGTDRKAMAQHFDCPKGWSRLLGATSHEYVLRPGLVGLGLVSTTDSQPYTYSITAAGRKALASRTKAKATAKAK